MKGGEYHKTITCQIGGKGKIEIWNVKITLDKRLIMEREGERREANLIGCGFSNPKRSRGKGKHWLRVDLQRNDQTNSGVSVNKYVFGFDTEEDKKLMRHNIEFFSLNQKVEEEKIIPYSEEGIQQLAELLQTSLRRKHAVVIYAHHGEMSEGNFLIPEGVEVIMKASIGHIVYGFPSNLELDQLSMYQFLYFLNYHITQGDIVDEEGCVNPVLAYMFQREEDAEHVNVKIYGKSNGRQELPEAFKEGEHPKKQLTNSEIRDIDEEVLRQHYANNVTMVFTDIDRYKKHGLLFEILPFGRPKYKVNLSLVTPEEISLFSDRKHISINDRVMDTLTKLRELTGHEFAVLFTKCRVDPSALNKQLSHKTDKSIDCWLKWYHDNLIERFADVLDTQKRLRGKITVEAKQFLIEFSQYLKTAFSTMNDVYDTLKENLVQMSQGTMQDTQPIERVLYSGNKKEIIDLVLLGCYLNCLLGFNFEESFFEKLTRIIKEKISSMDLTISLNIELFKDLRLLEYLFENEDIKVDIDATDKFGSPPLLNAVKLGNLEIVKYLIEKGANKEAVDRIGFTPLLRATQTGQFEIIQYLIEKGANKEAVDNSESTPLIIAVKLRNLEIVKYLIEKGANKEAVDKFEETPLLWAVESEDLGIVQYLVDAGANKEVVDRFGSTPLIIATEMGHLEIVKYLVDAGANKEAVNIAGNTPLLRATKTGKIEIVKYLMEKGANKEAVDNSGSTPLIIATGMGHLEIVKILVDAGANKEAVDINGNTPLLSAAGSEDLGIVQYLVDAGANKEAVDINGNTPLLRAVVSEEEDLEIVQYLVDAGANKGAVNNSGNTPLSYAEQEDYTEIIEILKAKHL